MCPLLLAHHCTILTEVMSITPHQIIADSTKITRKLFLGRLKKSSGTISLALTLVTPFWTLSEHPYAATDSQVTTKYGKKYITSTCSLHSSHCNPKRGWFSWHKCSCVQLVQDGAQAFFTELSSKLLLHTLCHCMEWVTGTVKPPQPYQGRSPCQRPGRGNCLLQD